MLKSIAAFSRAILGVVTHPLHHWLFSQHKTPSTISSEDQKIMEKFTRENGNLQLGMVDDLNQLEQSRDDTYHALIDMLTRLKMYVKYTKQAEGTFLISEANARLLSQEHFKGQIKTDYPPLPDTIMGIPVKTYIHNNFWSFQFPIVHLKSDYRSAIAATSNGKLYKLFVRFVENELQSFPLKVIEVIELKPLY